MLKVYQAYTKGNLLKDLPELVVKGGTVSASVCSFLRMLLDDFGVEDQNNRLDMIVSSTTVLTGVGVIETQISSLYTQRKVLNYTVVQPAVTSLHLLLHRRDGGSKSQPKATRIAPSPLQLFRFGSTRATTEVMFIGK